MDVDLSTDLDALLPLVAPLISGHSDVAIGTRLASNSHVARGPRREAISRTYNLLLKATLGSGFSDAQCGFKAVRADVGGALLPLIEDNGWFFDTELLVLAEHNGLRIHEVPVDWIDDPDSRCRRGRHHEGRPAGHLENAPQSRPRRHLVTRGVAVARPVDLGRSPKPTRALRIDRCGQHAAVRTALAARRSARSTAGRTVVALGVCALANTAANRRVTFRVAGADQPCTPLHRRPRACGASPGVDPGRPGVARWSWGSPRSQLCSQWSLWSTPQRHSDGSCCCAAG